MNTAGRLSAYGAALALVAGCGWAIGNAVGPFAENGGAEASTGHGDTHGGTVAEPHGTDTHETESHGTGAAPTEPAGLASAKNGYTFQPVSSSLTAGAANTFSFRITGPGGAAINRFDVEHDKRMHLIVVRRDTADFQHVHPEMAPDGTWTVPLKLAHAGSYRAFADFHPTGADKLTLGVDLVAPGEFIPRGYAPSRVSLVDGYQVNLDGDLVPGQSAKLTLTVRKDGREVTDLQPYLGAYGHLVALRGGDLAYLHVHPEGTPGDGKTASGPTVTFFAEVPSAGTYRLFLDFQHGGTVRTAEFTVSTAGSEPAPAPTAPAAPTAPTAPTTTEHSHAGGGH